MADWEAMSRLLGDPGVMRFYPSPKTIGALKPSGHIKGRKVWVAPAVIAALDEFALRAGRRKHP